MVRIAKAIRIRAQELDLNGLGLTFVPPSLRRAIWLRELNLGQNDITSVPDWLRELKKLRWLCFLYNQVTIVPDSLTELSSLETLDFHGNCLAQLPDSIGRLANLKELFLSDNRLSSLPEAIGHLTKLKVLLVAHNELRTLPTSLKLLRSLAQLDLEGNPSLGIPVRTSPGAPESNRWFLSTQPHDILDYYFERIDRPQENFPTEAHNTAPIREVPNQAASRPVVLSLHGIKTRGRWQKELAPILAEAGFTPEPLDYGNFLAIEMLLPYCRRKRIEWYFREYTKLADKYSDRQISIIAHSFGTYLVARSLEKYIAHIKYDVIIFCGAIVRRDYPWHNIHAGGHINQVLNQYGGKDLWATIVAYFVGDSGQSGRYGFQNAPACLTQSFHPEYRHSDYFHPRNFKDTWVPFLRHSKLPSATTLPPASRNYRFAIIKVGIVILLLGVVGYKLWCLFK